MTQTICKMYAGAAQAATAAAELKKNHFSDVHVFSPAQKTSTAEDGTVSTAPGASVDSILGELTKAHIDKYHAKEYAARIAKGAALVAVHAPFGTAGLAHRLLDGHGPVESGVPEHRDAGYEWNDAHPMSSAMMLPLLAHSKLPMENLTGFSSVTSGPAHFSRLLGMGMISKSRTPFSSMFGLSTLSSSKTPLSSAMGLPTISSNKTPLSSRSGMPVLKGK